MDVNVAFLVLAHSNPGHLGRLVRCLASERSTPFVHIDSKSDLDVDMVARIEGVEMASHRFAVHWGWFGAVEATLALLRQARRQGRFTHFVLVSGMDYPLIAVEDIITFFRAHPDELFLDSHPMPSPTKSLERLDYRGKAPRDAGEEEDQWEQRELRARRDRLDVEQALGGRKPYAGSQWWALPADAVDHVLACCDAEPDFVHFFRHTTVPDEMFFQTLLANSSFADRIRPNLTYCDWSKGGGHPAMLTEDHVEVLSAEARDRRLLFARKFPEESETLIRMIHAPE